MQEYSTGKVSSSPAAILLIALVLFAVLAILSRPAPAQPLAYVANSQSNTLSVIDTATNAVVGSPIPTGGIYPMGIAITPDGARAYVTSYSTNSVTVIDLTTNAYVGPPIYVGNHPIGIAITPDGSRAYVANSSSNNVSVIDIATNAVVGPPIPVGSLPHDIAITPDGTKAYVTNRNWHSPSVTALDTATNTSLGSIVVGKLPTGIAITPDGARAYVACNKEVYVIDTATDTTVGSPIPASYGLWGIAIAPDGTKAYVTSTYSNSVLAVDLGSNTVTGSIPVGSFPVDVEFTPDGTRAYVTNRLSNNVSVLDASTDTVALPPIGVGAVPNGIAVTPTPYLDHFACYKVGKVKPRFERRFVQLEDQFDTRATEVGKPRYFCNPADKNGEGIGDETAHLTCYGIRDAKGEPEFEKRLIVVKDQFGERALRVKKPKALCVPSEKQGVPSELRLDHFKCYKAEAGDEEEEGGGFAPIDITLTDEFTTRLARVVEPKFFCNPVDKDGEGIIAPEAHLTCYGLGESEGEEEFHKRQVTVENQFGTLTLAVRESELLCVPAEKEEELPPRGG